MDIDEPAYPAADVRDIVMCRLDRLIDDIDGTDHTFSVVSWGHTEQRLEVADRLEAMAAMIRRAKD